MFVPSTRWCFRQWDYLSICSKMMHLSSAAPQSTHNLSLSILTAIFPGEPRLAGFIEAKDDGGGGDYWSYKMCKAPVISSPSTSQHPAFLQAGCTEGKIEHIWGHISEWRCPSICPSVSPSCSHLRRSQKLQV